MCIRDRDLFALSQEPYHAELWRKKREAEDKEASKKKAKTKFGKFDLTSIIISKHLWSKDGLMAYAQDYGSYAMKDFVHNRIRTLQMDIEAAKEWDAKPTGLFAPTLPTTSVNGRSASWSERSGTRREGRTRMRAAEGDPINRSGGGGVVLIFEYQHRRRGVMLLSCE